MIIDRAAVEKGRTANQGPVVAILAVAVQFLKILTDLTHVIEGVGPPGMARDQHPLPRSEAGIDFALNRGDAFFHYTDLPRQIRVGLERTLSKLVQLAGQIAQGLFKFQDVGLRPHGAASASITARSFPLRAGPKGYRRSPRRTGRDPGRSGGRKQGLQAKRPLRPRAVGIDLHELHRIFLHLSRPARGSRQAGQLVSRLRSDRLILEGIVRQLVERGLPFPGLAGLNLRHGQAKPRPGRQRPGLDDIDRPTITDDRPVQAPGER